MRVVLAALVFVLVVAAPAQASLKVVDVGSGKRRTIAKGENWGSLRWTPDGQALIAVRGSTVRRVALAGGRGQVVARLGDPVDSVLSPDGSVVASVYDGDRGLVVREVGSGRVLARLRQAAEGDDLYENGLALAFSRDGSRFAYLALEKQGKTLRIVRTRGGTVLRRLSARRMFGLSLEAWSPSGDRVAFASGNAGGLRVLDVASGDARRLDATTIELAWAPAGERIALGGGDGVRISDERQRFGEPIEAGEAVDFIRWSPNGTALALVLENVVSDYKRALAVLSLTPPGKPRILVPYSDRGVSAPQWSPDATRIAYSG